MGLRGGQLDMGGDGVLTGVGAGLPVHSWRVLGAGSRWLRGGQVDVGCKRALMRVVRLSVRS